METKEKKPGEPVVASGVTVIPIIETSFCLFEGHRTLTCSGMKIPVQVIIRDKNGVHAFSCEGDEIPLHDLIREVPGLEKLLQTG